MALRQNPWPAYKSARKAKAPFRWPIFVGIPLVVMAFLYVLKGIEPSFAFEDIMESLHIFEQDRYVRLTCLCVVCVVILLIVKLFRR